MTCCGPFREFLTWRQSGAIILGEANVMPKTDMKYFGEAGERLQMMFNFDVNQHLFYALASGDARPLMKAHGQTEPRPASAQWGQFLRNHDELDLGRLTKAAANESSTHLVLKRTCSFMTAVSGAAWRRCCRAIGAGWNWPTA